jgi:hypothetical protein
MNLKKSAPLMIAVLVLGLALGNVLSSAAAPTTDNTASAGVTGLGLRLGGAMRDAGGRLSDVVAKLTGLDVDQVEDQHHAGTSFAAIAKTKGVTSDELVAEALKVREQLLDEKVKSGEITQAQADDALARMKDRLTDRVDSTDVGRGMGGRGMGGRGQGGCGGGGMGGGAGRGAGAGACDGSCSAQPPVVTQ